jgi:hypothetical protein
VVGRVRGALAAGSVTRNTIGSCPARSAIPGKGGCVSRGDWSLMGVSKLNSSECSRISRRQLAFGHFLKATTCGA